MFIQNLFADPKAETSADATGAAGFEQYDWREFANQVSGTFFTEAILPTFVHEDPRYYTLGRGGFFRRAPYAITRTVITKNDAGGEEFNISEIGGNVAEASLSNFYYPATSEKLIPVMFYGNSSWLLASGRIICLTQKVDRRA
ncbi:MAG: hypothetical protein ABI158_06270 [Edaphobacter sp.]